MRRQWRIGLPGACEHWWPKWPVRGLSANQVACALISMMARSTTGSNQKPDTLMQDRSRQVDETSCTARPDHTSGSKAEELKVSITSPVLPGGFNWSAQHLLILRDEEVLHGDITGIVHCSAESRALGAMEERAKCCGHIAGA